MTRGSQISKFPQVLPDMYESIEILTILIFSSTIRSTVLIEPPVIATSKPVGRKLSFLKSFPFLNP